MNSINNNPPAVSSASALSQIGDQKSSTDIRNSGSAKILYGDQNRAKFLTTTEIKNENGIIQAKNQVNNKNPGALNIYKK